jgi:3-hydroxybutyryl-CoA dehydrogenase
MKTIGVIGAGQMGSGIAQVAAFSGFSVVLQDVKKESVERGLSNIEKNLNRIVEKGKMTSDQKTTALKNIQTTTELSSMKNVDMIIEAATENVELKLHIFKSLDEICKTNTIFCSNTSSISITKIASATQRPEKVVGLHFMNPVPVMKLVEVIKGLLTSNETYKMALEVAVKMNKETVTALDSPGFLVNRILCPMINEAICALESGIATAEDIDKAMKLGTNQPMGPLELADFVGLDTVLAIMEVLHQGFGEDKFRPSPLLRKYVTAGLLGRKSGRGFFTYANA